MSSHTGFIVSLAIVAILQGALLIRLHLRLKKANEWIESRKEKEARDEMDRQRRKLYDQQMNISRQFTNEVERFLKSLDPVRKRFQIWGSEAVYLHGSASNNFSNSYEVVDTIGLEQKVLAIITINLVDRRLSPFSLQYRNENPPDGLSSFIIEENYGIEEMRKLIEAVKNRVKQYMEEQRIAL